MSEKPQPTYFVTGFPGFIGKRLVARLADRAGKASIILLVQEKFLEDVRRYVRTLRRRARIEVLQGDIVDMHLGLSGAEYGRLCDEVTDIFHLAAYSYLGGRKEVARRVNVEGTRNVVELARDCTRLHRLAYFSTAFVSGDREGVVAEDELEMGQSFRSFYEETKHEAEKVVRHAMKDVPTVIFRPSIVVGDSKTGEIDRFEGPYFIGIAMVLSPVAVPLPLPAGGIAPVNCVPVDFVVEAALALAKDDRAVGRTFHLVDPCPMSARRVYELIAKRVGKKVTGVSVPARAAEALMRIPFLEKLARPQRAALSTVSYLTTYSCRNTLELLEGTGIRCPPLETYLDKLVEFAREFYRRRREETSAVDDPLDQPSHGRAT